MATKFVERHKQHKQASKCEVGKTIRFIVFCVKHKNAKQLLAKKNYPLINSLITYPRHIRNRILRKSKDITSKIIRE